MNALTVKAQFKAVSSARRLALREACKAGKEAFSKVFRDSRFELAGVVMYHNWFITPDNRPVSFKVFMLLDAKLTCPAEKRALWDKYSPERKFK
jgi:hypothetical protein